MFKNILVSVSDKSGLVDFLKQVTDSKTQIVSSGGTAQFLTENNFKVTSVDEVTGFPEVMGGRVKTLHPKIHMQILYRAQDSDLLTEHQLMGFDLVVVNLYPFEESLAKNLDYKSMIEKIDVGGPAMVRGAAKNHERVSVIVDPRDYVWIAKKLNLEFSDRQFLAAKALAHTSQYDGMIANYLHSQLEKKKEDSNWPLQLFAEHFKTLRYGENPNQSADWYIQNGAKSGLHQAQIIQGKELSYNNILDIEAAYTTCQSMHQVAPKMNSTVAVKHTNPCGVAWDKNDSLVSLKNTLKADPVSVFGGIITCNYKIEVAHAELLKDIFLECVLAPEFSDEALQILANKKNLRLLAWPNAFIEVEQSLQLKIIPGGLITQQSHQINTKTDHWKLEGPSQLAESRQLDLQLAEIIAAHLKSNAIALVKNGQSIGLGMGQVNRVDAVQHALERAKKHNPHLLQQSVLASDAFFPFADSIELIAQSGVEWVLQPGGSMRDAEVIAAAQKLGLKLVLTGERHFKH